MKKMDNWDDFENQEFEGEDLNNIKKFLDKLETDSIDHYYRLCYKALVESPEEMLSHGQDTQIKLRGLNKLINYFKDREEYEKCGDLNKLLKMIANT